LEPAFAWHDDEPALLRESRNISAPFLIKAQMASEQLFPVGIQVAKAIDIAEEILNASKQPVKQRFQWPNQWRRRPRRIDLG
jgi:hypothetical protein